MVHLGSQDGRLCSIAEIAERYNISHDHLMKVVQELAASGFVETMRARSGGLCLARPAKEISLGALVR
jgi:Rrf2 family nitric oxide-sensitive transcriptional repressor